MRKQKKKIFIILICLIITLSINALSFASQEEILQNQSETLNIKGFIDKANKYTKETFDGIDAGELLTQAISGNIDNKTIFEKILNIFGKEIKSTITIIRKHYYYSCYP